MRGYVLVTQNEPRKERYIRISTGAQPLGLQYVTYAVYTYVKSVRIR